MLLFTRAARFGPARRAVGGRGDPRVPAPAVAAAGDEDAFSLVREIRKQPRRLVGIAGPLVNERADRHGELEVRSGVARAVRAHAVLTAIGSELRMKSVV